jgi:protein-disulfide isomerase
MPVPVWGVLAYFTYVSLLRIAWLERQQQKDGWALLQVLSLLFCLYSAALAIISVFYVKSYCAMCILSYAVNLLLLFYTWIIRKRFKLLPIKTGLIHDTMLLWRYKPARWVGGFIIFIAILGIAVFPTYWHTSLEPLRDDVATGTTEDGHPWIGAKSPLIEIEEYTDYLCFQCRKMHIYLRRLVSQYPDRVRLIHRQFPMDHEVNPIVKEPFHVGSGQMAIIAIYATEKNKFWSMNDALFSTGRNKGDFSLKQLSEQTGLDLKGLQAALSIRKDLHWRLSKDIWDGIKLGISGTPAYVIDGQVYLSQIPPKILKRVID